MESIRASQASKAVPARDFPSQAMPELRADAVVLHGAGEVSLQRLDLHDPAPGEIIVETEASSISAGTEKLFWSGDMPPFPGMGYPLVPGYESVGRVVWAEPGSPLIGQRVFVPGAHSFAAMRALFGGAASRLIAAEDRVHSVGDMPTEEALLLSLAATAYHAVDAGEAPDLIVGFGALGRLLHRITIALGHPAPKVWEINPARKTADGVQAMCAEDDPCRSYRQVYDASGDAAILDSLVGALTRGGTVVLAGFYPGRVGFSFAPAFQKEARLRIAAEWRPGDLDGVMRLIDTGKLSLSGLVSHRRPWTDADAAYRTAFTDPDCFKMILEWENA